MYGDMVICDSESRWARVRSISAIVSVMLAIFMLGSCASSREASKKRAVELTRQAYEEHWGKDWDKVVELTSRAIEANPSVSWPYSVRGAAYNAMGQPELALKDLDQALELYPFFVEALVNRAVVNIGNSNLKLAEKDLSDALKLSPNDVSALLNMARVQGRQGSTTEACTYLLRAVENGFTDLADLLKTSDFNEYITSDCYVKAQDLMSDMYAPEEK